MKEKLIHFLEDLNAKQNYELLNVDIIKYVDKIKEHATIISSFKNDDLIAFIAFYENDPSLDVAFLSMLAVKDDFKKMGLGKTLLELSIKEVEKKGFKSYGLEVMKNNMKAIKLYEKFDFAYVEDRKNNFIYMKKTL